MPENERKVRLKLIDKEQFWFYVIFSISILVFSALTWLVTWPVFAIKNLAPHKIAVSFKYSAIKTMRVEQTISVASVLPLKEPKTKAAIADTKSVGSKVAAPTLEIAAPQIVPPSETLQSQVSEPEPPKNLDDRPPPSAYPDKPYGSALVLAIKIDSDGNPLDVVIEVPSFQALNDLTFVMATRKIKFTNITPPVPPGTSIWIERRIEYDDPLKDQLP